MRYFQKLLCLLILVLAASFGVGGCVLLYSDFSVQRSRMAAANAAAHAQACTLLQTEILDLQRRGISTGDAALTARVTAQGVPAALWQGDTLVCATLEGLQSLPLGDAATVTVRTENSIYAVYASDLQGGLRLVTAYDLTGLYRDRNAALMRFLLLEAAVLAAAFAVTALLARRLTRPLAVLTDAGAQIAAGDYARRTDLHTGDEIEALSRSFDKMADAVQEKIADLEADVQRREDFVGAFTHELKTPMTSIIGGIMLDDNKIEKLVQDNVAKLSIKTPSSKTQIQSLSGGNQQKVLIARWLANDPDVFIMDEPTRGIDVGAKYEIYCIIAEMAKQGKSIIMISSEMSELIGMSDRIMVMCDGRCTGFIDGDKANQENIMTLATQFE